MPGSTKCVLFDYGNVISLPQTIEARQKQADLTGLSLASFRKLWGQYRASYDQGIVDGQTYWSRILAHSRIAVGDGLTDRLIQADIESWKPTDTWILDWAQVLRDSGIQTGVLSNMPTELVADTRMSEWIEGFAPLFFSAEIKANKPYAPIYAHVTRLLECSPAETLFIDDREDNIRGAQRAGLQTILHSSWNETRSQVRANHDLPLPGRSHAYR